MVSRQHITPYEQGRADVYRTLKVAELPSWEEMKQSVYDKLPLKVQEALKGINTPQFDWLWKRRRPTLLNLAVGESGDTLKDFLGTDERAETHARGGNIGQPVTPAVTGERPLTPLSEDKG